MPMSAGLGWASKLVGARRLLASAAAAFFVGGALVPGLSRRDPAVIPLNARPNEMYNRSPSPERRIRSR
jgi:hypothetical protein